MSGADHPLQELTTRDGCVLRYRDVPAGADADPQAAPVVLLHGWSQSQATFDRLLPHVTDRRVVTVDMRNHGESGRTDRGARVSSLAGDLRELLDHLGLAERVHLLGHSMGSSVLWSYVDLHGTAGLESIVLVDQPSVCALSPWLSEEDVPRVGAILDAAGADAFCRVLLGDDGPKAREDFLTSMLSPDISAEDHAWLLEQNLLLPMPWGSRLLMDHVFQDWRDVLPAVDVPCLVVGGEVSHVAPASQEWIASQVPGATLRVFTRVEGGSHFPFFEQPETFAEVLRDHLRAAEAAAVPVGG